MAHGTIVGWSAVVYPGRDAAASCRAKSTDPRWGRVDHRRIDRPECGWQRATLYGEKSVDTDLLDRPTPPQFVPFGASGAYLRWTP